MMLNEVVDAMAFAGEVVVAAYMLQTAMKLAIIPVAAITTILRIVFSLQEVVQPCSSCLIFAASDAVSRDAVNEYFGKGAVALCSRAQVRNLSSQGLESRSPPGRASYSPPDAPLLPAGPRRSNAGRHRHLHKEGMRLRR
jgi:hypothetical protein